ncbi:MAG TPA: zf-TFIIB domain-containing protein [bacterium]|nr:zf-TFIIB domain-containing protein [bacterium]
MACPDCQAQLEQLNYKGVAFEECPNCRGRWFDRGQLKAAKDRTDEDLRWLNFDPFGEDADKYAVAAPRVVLCPKCGRQMVALRYAASGVTIYKCPVGDGVWLSHGEFAAIVAYLEKLVDSQSAEALTKDAVKQLERVDVRDFLTVMKLLNVRLAVEHPRLARAVEKIQEYSPLK